MTHRKTAIVSVRPLEGLMFFVVALVLHLTLVLIQIRQYTFVGVPGITDPENALATWGTSDAGSYLGAALSIRDTGGIAPGWQWVTNIWSPGMPRLLNFAMSTALGDDKFLLVLGLLGALLAAVVITLVYWALRLYISRWLAISLLAFTVAQPIYWRYLLVDRLPWSDGYPSLLVIGGISLMFIATKTDSMRQRWILSAMSGCFLAAALYIRGQWLYLPHILLLTSFIVGVAVAVVRQVRRPSLLVAESRALSRQVVVGAIAGIVGLSLAMPYAIWRENKFPDAPADFGFGYGWTMSSMISAHYNWLYPDQLAGFVVDGGGGTACRVDRQKCESIHAIEQGTESPFNIYDDVGLTYSEYNKETFQAAITHPVEWFKIKAPKMWEFWTAPISSTGVLKWSDQLLSKIVLVNLWWLVVAYQRRQQVIRSVIRNTLLVVQVAALMFLIFVPPYLAHIEVRYFFLARLILIPFTAFTCYSLSRKLVMMGRGSEHARTG